MKVAILGIALASISLSAVAQLLMKTGMTDLRAAVSGGSEMLLAVATNPYVAAGFAAYGVGAILWLKVLSQLDLSLAYPLVSLGFVMVAALSWLVLGEHLSLGRIAGITLIVIGVTLMGSF